MNAVFASQRAWRAAAAYRDGAKGLAPGTSELENGTKLAGAEACASAQLAGTGTFHVHADGSGHLH